MSDTKALVRASLLLAFLFMSFGAISVTLRFSIEVFILVFTCKNVNFNYARLMALAIPLYELSTGVFPSVLGGYVIFMMLANLMFVIIINRMENTDIILQLTLATVIRFMTFALSFYFCNDLAIFISLTGILEFTIIGGFIGTIFYNVSIRALSKRKLI